MSSKDKLKTVPRKFYSEACALHQKQQQKQNKNKKRCDGMIKQLLNSIITKYRGLSVSRKLMICLSIRLRQIIGLLATDKSASSNNC